jgi:predicted deacylase
MTTLAQAPDQGDSNSITGKIPYDSMAPRSRERMLLPVAAMADGASLALPVLVATGSSLRPRLVCVGGIHGNEPEGVTALLEFWDALDLDALNGTLVLVPVANPPAFRAGERRNPGDPLDMNRIFPGQADGTITERLAHRLYHDVVVGADVVLSLHGWGRGGLVVPYTEYPRDGAVAAASRAAAAAFGLGWLEAFDWPPGMLVAVCTRHGIPAIEPEIGGLECTVPERRDLYKRGIINLCRHLGLLPGMPEVPARVADVTRIAVAAATGGVLRREVELGDPIVAGQRIAVIGDLLGRHQAEVVSPVGGFVAAQRLTAAVEPGDQVAVIFTPEEC